MNYKTYIGSVILAFMVIIVLITAIDFIVYTIKTGAKQSTLDKWVWKTGFMCAVALLSLYILYLCEK